MHIAAGETQKVTTRKPLIMPLNFPPNLPPPPPSSSFPFTVFLHWSELNSNVYKKSTGGMAAAVTGTNPLAASHTIKEKYASHSSRFFFLSLSSSMPNV